MSLVAGAVVEAAPAAGAKPAWSTMSFPNPSGSTATDFEGVSCPTAKSCFAVGFYRLGKSQRTLVERWDGSRWSVMASPNPGGATNAYLYGVSCPSATNCFAVGGYSTATAPKTLVERWDGISWTIVNSPTPNGSTNPFLESVSCPSASLCFAVGHSLDTTGRSLLEQWDGISWSITTIPKFEGATETALFGVSCASVTSCFAVGYYQPLAEAALVTLVERWDGSTWSVMTSPSPAGAVPAGLAAVACPSPTSCFAVGGYSPGSGRKSLVERWNGTSWAVIASPYPASTRTTLSEVSCASTTSCFAVGHYFQGATGKTLVERWNGSSWSVMASPNPTASTDSWLKAASCPSPTRCFAVGTATIKKVVKGLIERYA